MPAAATDAAAATEEASAPAPEAVEAAATRDEPAPAAATAAAAEKTAAAAAPPEEDERVYDEVDLADMEWDEDDGMYLYQCPCGDMFEISKADLAAGERIARCPSCSLIIRVTAEEAAMLEATT